MLPSLEDPVHRPEAGATPRAGPFQKSTCGLCLMPGHAAWSCKSTHIFDGRPVYCVWDRQRETLVSKATGERICLWYNIGMCRKTHPQDVRDVCSLCGSQQHHARSFHCSSAHRPTFRPIGALSSPTEQTKTLVTAAQTTVHTAALGRHTIEPSFPASTSEHPVDDLATPFQPRTSAQVTSLGSAGTSNIERRLAEERHLRTRAESEADAACHQASNARARASAAQQDEAEELRKLAVGRHELFDLRRELEHAKKTQIREAAVAKSQLAESLARAEEAEARVADAQRNCDARIRRSDALAATSERGNDAPRSAAMAERLAAAAEAKAECAQTALKRATDSLAAIQREKQGLAMLPAVFDAMKLVASTPSRHFILPRSD
jgi:hypothetical protein